MRAINRVANATFSLAALAVTALPLWSCSSQSATATCAHESESRTGEALFQDMRDLNPTFTLDKNFSCDGDDPHPVYRGNFRGKLALSTIPECKPTAPSSYECTYDSSNWYVNIGEGGRVEIGAL